MALRRIVIDIETTVDRNKFDATVKVDGEELSQEHITRSAVHDLARAAVNTAFDSFK